MQLAYELVDPKAREDIDLTRYEIGIKNAVQNVCGSEVKVTVSKNEYVLETKQEPTAVQKRSIGREISFYCPCLREAARIYASEGCYNNKSIQIFKRKR